MLFRIFNIVIGIILFLSADVSAQQGNVWYFGNYSGIDFNGGIAKPITDGRVFSEEGTASVCDFNGNLLFYTDGVTVYDRTHSIMFNGSGLLGNQSSVHAAIIIPKPGSSSKYFVFTSDADGSFAQTGYNYSEIDMTINNGLGGVTATKNQLLYRNSTERLAALKHSNGLDYWLITKELGTNNFFTYKVSCAGVSLDPVISSVGINHSNDPIFHNGGRGAIKVSSNGKKVCVAIMEAGIAQLFDFDNSTGLLSNPIDLPGYNPGGGNIYGIEFSPDGSLLYISDRAGQFINQYDIRSGNGSLINASKRTITSIISPYALQVGPDGKIYVAHLNNSRLGVINSPNIIGFGCNYLSASFDLNGSTSAAGLPSFPVNFFQPRLPIDFTFTFVGCKVRFNAIGLFATNTKLNWNFGDGDIDTGLAVFHSYRKTGKYKVHFTAVVKNECNQFDTLQLEKEIDIGDVIVPGFSFAPLCYQDSTYFSDTSFSTSGNVTGWTWEFGDGESSNTQNPSHLYKTLGQYQIKLVISTNGVCRSDSITKIIRIETKPEVFFKTRDGCVKQTILLSDSSSNMSGAISNFTWNFSNGIIKNGKEIQINFDSAGRYSFLLTVRTDGGCSSSKMGTLEIESIPVVNFRFDSACIGKTIDFVNSTTNYYGVITKWNWDFGDNSSSLQFNTSHAFSTSGIKKVTLQASTRNGCSGLKSHNFNVDHVTAYAGNDTSVIAGTKFQIFGSGGIKYEWSPSIYLDNPSISSPTITPDDNIQYILKVTNTNGCIGYDSVFIKVFKGIGVFVPNAFTPNNDSRNDILKPILRGIKLLKYFKVYNRWGQLVFETSSLSAGWDGRIHGVISASGNYIWVLEAIDISGRLIRDKGNTLLIR